MCSRALDIRSIIVVCLIALFSIQANAFTVVIDPGHGGKNIGARGVKAKEKEINFAVSKLLGAMIENNHDDVKVVFTRNDDTFIPLKRRAEIANDAGGDLFISIHTNSVAKSAKNRKTIAGASVYTLGLHRSDDNLEVAQRENSVIELEDDYSTTYSGFDPNSSESYIIFELNQNIHMEQSIEFANAVQDELVKTAGRKDHGVRQAGFLVLANTSMPAVLVELDFICNPTQEKFLNSARGQKRLATAIYNAFCQYKSKQDRLENKEINAAPAKEKKKETTAEGKIEYKIQFLTSDKKLAANDKRLKGLQQTDYYKENNIYKYTYGRTSSWDEALALLKEIKTRFPEAFIIKTRNGKRIK